MFVKIASLVALAATTVIASPAPSLTVRAVALNPPSSVVQGDAVLAPQLETRDLTNGKRLTLGLPLLPPSRRHQGGRRPKPSQIPAKFVDGYIKITNADTGINIGFIRSTPNSFGEYGGTSDPTQYLEVRIDTTAAALGPSDIKTLNGIPGFPILGAINGFSSTSDLTPGSFNYQYIGGSNQTPPNSPPTSPGNSFTAATNLPETSESAIFRYDPGTKGITVQYVNTDGSKPATFIGYTQDVLVLTGDKTAFTNTFGPTVWLKFTFVPK